MQPELIGGRYRVGRAVGRGGMGTVWLARDEKLQRDVAVKQVGLLPGESVTDSARALREARSSAALGHRNVVTVFDVVEERGAIWLVMEYVPSRSLAEMVAQEGPLDPAVVADIGAQVADGLAAAHALGVMHRDVKPGNVLVREDGLAKISDFGIARSAGDPALTQSGLLTGTPSYFSPELARGAPPTPASDVWALGATLYAAVEGRPPYPPRANPIALLHDIADRQPPAPRRAAYLEPVLLRLMDRDPGSRWSMTDAAHALRRLAEEHRPERTLAQTRAWTGAEPVRPPAAVPGGPAAAPRRTDARSVAPSTGPSTDPSAGSSVDATGVPAAAPVTDGPVRGGAGGSRADARRGASPPPRAADPRRGSAGGPGRGVRYALLGALVVLLLAAGLGYALSQGMFDDTRGTASGDPTSTPRSSPSNSPRSSPTRSPTRSPSVSSSGSSSGSAGSRTASGAASPTTSTGQGGPGGVAAEAAFLNGYFQVAGTDQGWAELSSNERSVGRASYDSFWGSIDSATVSDVTDTGDGRSVEATVRYRWSSGRVVEERQRLYLVPSGDSFLIDDEHVLSSRTLSP